MTDRIDTDPWPSPRGPWHEVHDLSRLFDHGRPWCINVAGHPVTSDYPDPELHVPWHECRSWPTWLDGARHGLGGDALAISVYLAAPFRFGELRASVTVSTDVRLVVETVDTQGDVHARTSISLGDATHLARIMNRLVDRATPLGHAS